MRVRAKIETEFSTPAPTRDELRSARALLKAVSAERMSAELTATENDPLTDDELVALSHLLIDYAISEWEGGRHARNSAVPCIAANLAFQVQRPGGKPVASIIAERLKSDPQIESRMRAFLRDVGQPDDEWSDRLDILAKDGNYTAAFGLKGQNRISRSDCDNDFVPAFQRYLKGHPKISKMQLQRYLVAVPPLATAFLAGCTTLAPTTQVVGSKIGSSTALKWAAGVVATIASVAIVWRCGRAKPARDRLAVSIGSATESNSIGDMPLMDAPTTSDVHVANVEPSMISGSEPDLAPHLVTAQGPFYFGYVPLAKDGGSVEHLAISNGGRANLHISRMAIVGDTAITFAYEQGPCAELSTCDEMIVLGHPAATLIPLRCDPKTYGKKSAILTVQSDDPDRPGGTVVSIDCLGTPVRDWKVISVRKGLQDGVTEPELLQLSDKTLGIRVRSTAAVSELAPIVTADYFKMVFSGGFVYGNIGDCISHSTINGTLRLHVTLQQRDHPGAMHIVRVAPLTALNTLGVADPTALAQCVYDKIAGSAFEPIQDVGYWTVVVEFEIQSHK